MSIIRGLSKEIDMVDHKMGRAKTTGKAEGVVVQLTPSGASVDVDPALLSKKSKEKLEKNLAKAVDQALDKQRVRAQKEVDKLLSQTN
jgi:DNA-binding protein YbaB